MWHIDENRAFLNSERLEDSLMYVRLKADPNFYQVLKSLYGLKTSPRDYQMKTRKVLAAMGFTPLAMCSCIYKKVVDNKILLIYAYVDDFLFTGADNALVYKEMKEFRKVVMTGPPIRNPREVLGMKLTRHRKNKLIFVSMEKKIEKAMEALVAAYGITIKAKHTPMRPANFLTKETEFETLSEEMKAFLDDKNIQLYMSILGSINWIGGIRHDVSLPLLYLSWSAKNPRQHHLEQALYTLFYLYRTKYIPLTLGGNTGFNQTSFCDAALGNATKGRSIVGAMSNLGEQAGMITCKSTITLTTVTSIFEAELDAYVIAAKACKRVSNVLREFNQPEAQIPEIKGDNNAVVEFITGNGVARGVRHMELRQWYMREQYQMHSTKFQHIDGKSNPADKLTKISDAPGHTAFTIVVMGLGLVGATSILNEGFFRELEIPDIIDDPMEFPFVD
jgi:hypothetical protein